MIPVFEDYSAFIWPCYIVSLLAITALGLRAWLNLRSSAAQLKKAKSDAP